MIWSTSEERTPAERATVSGVWPVMFVELMVTELTRPIDVPLDKMTPSMVFPVQLVSIT
jgi:hypothetical protein